MGKELIKATKFYLPQQGYEEVFVQADKADGFAIDFNRQTSPIEEEDVLRFYYTLSG